LNSELVEKLRKNFKIESLENYNKILCVQPHPDDMDIAIGATVKKLSEMGKNITYITVTDGGLGTYDKNITRQQLSDTRKAEQLKASEFLGVKENYFLNFEDGGSYTVEQVSDVLIPLFRSINPEIVITVDPYLEYEIHPDHIKCGKAVNMALLFYGFPGYHIKENIEKISEGKDLKALGYVFTRNPNYFYNVDGYFRDKFEALKLHESQDLDENKNKAMAEFCNYFRIKACFYGEKIGCEYAEEMKILSTSMLHCFSEAAYL